MSYERAGNAPRFARSMRRADLLVIVNNWKLFHFVLLVAGVILTRFTNGSGFDLWFIMFDRFGNGHG